MKRYCRAFPSVLVVMLGPAIAAVEHRQSAGCIACVLLMRRQCESKSQGSSKSKRQEQVWLPGLQVWAALGSRTKTPRVPEPRPVAATPRIYHDHSQSPRMSSSTAAVSLSVQCSAQAAGRAEDTVARLEAIVEDSLPTCPICEAQATCQCLSAISHEQITHNCVSCRSD